MTAKTKQEMVDLHYQLVMELQRLPEIDIFGEHNAEAKEEVALTLVELGRAISGVEVQNLDDDGLVQWLTGKDSLLSVYGV